MRGVTRRGRGGAASRKAGPLRLRGCPALLLGLQTLEQLEHDGWTPIAPRKHLLVEVARLLAPQSLTTDPAPESSGTGPAH